MSATASYRSELPHSTGRCTQLRARGVPRRLIGAALVFSFIACALARPAAQAEMTFPCTTFGRDCSDRILDAQPTGVSSTITVPGGTCALLGDVRVAVQVHHTWVGDLVATITHRGTTKTATLLDRVGVPSVTPFGCFGEDIDVTIADDAADPVASTCAGTIPAIAGLRRPPAVGCPLYFNSDNARFGFSCRFRGGWNTTCGNNQLVANLTSDGTQLTVRFPTVAGSPQLTASVQSPVTAQLNQLSIVGGPPTPIAGSAAIEAAGATLVVDPSTVPFSINGCAVERYVGSFDDFVGNDPAIDSTRPLTIFEGDSCDGSWELSIIDFAHANTGKLLGWSLILAPAAPPTPSPTGAPTPTATASPSRTATLSGSPTATSTIVATATATNVKATATVDATASVTASRSPTRDLSHTPTATESATLPPLTSSPQTNTPTASPQTNTPTASPQTNTPTAPPTAVACVGDCDGSGKVRVNELVSGVNIALDRLPLATCPAFDRNGSAAVEVDELVAAVNNALRGCGGSL